MNAQQISVLALVLAECVLKSTPSGSSPSQYLTSVAAESKQLLALSMPNFGVYDLLMDRCSFSRSLIANEQRATETRSILTDWAHEYSKGIGAYMHTVTLHLTIERPH